MLLQETGPLWYHWLLLAAAAALAVFAWVKALKASRKRRERLRREGELWKLDARLREEYRLLTAEKLQSADDEDLLRGVAMNIQMALEKEPDMNAAFAALSPARRAVYALDVFAGDAPKGLSVFFRSNGYPLLPETAPALAAIGETEYLPLLEKLGPMFDPDSEVSVDNDVIAEADEQFRALYKPADLYQKAAAFIRANKTDFLPPADKEES